MSGWLQTTPAEGEVTAKCCSTVIYELKAALRAKALGVFCITISLPALMFLSGCAKSSNSSSSGSRPLVVSPRDGSLQTALVGTAFAQPLVAGATRSGIPTAGVPVTFTAPSSGAGGTFANGTATETDTTDINGLATSSKFTANATTGTFTVVATNSRASASASFSLANDAVAINAQNGSLQNATVGTAFTQPLSAVVDQNGSPVSGVTVTFSAPLSGASGTFAKTGTTTETDTTDSTGVATSSAFTANANAGTYTVSATTPGASTPTGFSLTNNPIAPGGIFATTGIVQKAQTGTGFGKMVATVVDGGGHPMSGIPVTFTAPSSGAAAGGTFGNGSNTEIVTSDPNGLATSSDFTANATAGQYNVTASVTANGTLATANFFLTNVQTGTTLTSYTFYVSGQSQSHSGVGRLGINFYSLAGAITVDQSGNVIGGEEDYNDANGYTYTAVSILRTGSSLTASPTTGQGTLVLNTGNPLLGNAGIEKLAVQFVNAAHAVIMQWDGSATSSGSMDVQNLSSAPSGGYAFTLSGIDPAPVALGGVLASSGNLLNPWAGTLDVNDTNLSVSTGNPFTATVSAMDAYGRGQITGISIFGTPLTIEYYELGPEALRMIDVDAALSAIGSAFGQGTNATGATPSALGSSTFAIVGNAYSSDFGAVGQFTTDGSGNLPSGIADDHEFGNGVSATAAAVTGTYSVGTNGYGTLTFAPGLGNVSKLGLYLTDPHLNLNDPNNSTGGGGALLLDLDTSLPASASLAGGTGIITPQTDPSIASFAGNYAANWQAFKTSGCSECEFDMLAQGSMTAGGALSLNGMVSDPFQILTTTLPVSSGDTFGSTPLAASSNLGRYTMLSTNTNPNPLEMMITTTPPFYSSFDVVLYQASGAQLFWMEVDSRGVFVGTLEQQGSLTGIPAMKKHLTANDIPHPAETGRQILTKRASTATPEN